MAIQTGGFRVNNMPVYTPVDPYLVASNPGAALQGFGTATQLASMLENIKAQRQRREMMDAIMQGQIAAENAKNQQTVAISQPQTQSLLSGFDLNVAKNAAEKSLIPSSLSLQKGINEQGLRKLEPVTNAEIAKAGAEEAAANSQKNLNQLRETTTSAQLNALQKDLESADQERESKVAAAIAQNKLAKAKSTDLEQSLAADKALEDAKKKAEVDYLKAHAKYFEQGGAVRPDKDPATQIRALGLAAKAIEDQYQLGTYESKTYDENGKVRPYLFGFGKMSTDPAKENALSRVKTLRQAQNVLLKKWVDNSLNEAGVVQAQQAPQQAKPTSTADDVLKKYGIK